MKNLILFAASAAVLVLVSCDTDVNTSPPGKVTEKNTTIINPPAKEDKTIIVNPPVAPATEPNR